MTAKLEVPAEFWSRFADLRSDLFAAIKRELEIDGYCKSYEGAFELRFPDYFEEEDGNGGWGITLHCYVIGPGRHHYWSGASPLEALTKCERDIRSWIEEAKDEDQT